MLDFNERFIYEDGLLLNRKTRHIYTNYDRDGYIRVRIDGREYRAHRIIWEMHNGPIPEGMLIDHIDGDTKNNKLDNLRLATRQQNNANRTKTTLNCTVGAGLPKGVIKTSSGKFRARISYYGENYSLGTYDTAEQASEAYCEAAGILNGEFAHTH